MSSDLSDLSHVPTLGYLLSVAFPVVAERYGARLEGLPDDANEHSLFWQSVAAQVLGKKGPANV